jgi:3-oxoacyl-[acyl-carrier protein] reductase
MAARGFGRILNITSSSVLAPIEGLDLSSGARAGLTAYLAGVARQVAGRNVTVNSVLPGRMDTTRLTGGWEATARKSGRPLGEIAKAAVREIPAGRLGTPEEFGQICAFLCSIHGGYITGQNLLVDGGLIARSF